MKTEDENAIQFEIMGGGGFEDAALAKLGDMLEKSSQQKLKEVAKSFGGDIVEPVVPIFDLAHLVLNSTWHARCVEIVATAATSPGWDVEEEDGADASGKTDEIKKYLDLASKCEAISNLSALQNALAYDLRSLGTAYVEVVRDNLGRPAKFYHVPALTVRRRQSCGFWQLANLARDTGETAYNTEGLPRQARQSFQIFAGGTYSKTYFKEFGDEQEWTIDGNPVDYTPTEEERATELIPIFNYHPLSILYGIPSFISSFSSMVSDEAAEKWNLAFFENNRVPRWLFKIVGYKMKPEEREEFKLYFSQILKGRAHAPMMLALPNENCKIECEKLETDINEASFLELRRMNRDEIIASHGVPPRLVGVISPGSLGGQGDAHTQREDFRDFAVVPMQRLLFGWVNDLILPDAGYGGYVVSARNFDIQSAEEFERKSNSTTKLFERGIISVNEARQMLGLDAKAEAWADKHYMMQGESFLEATEENLAESDQSTRSGMEVSGALSRMNRQFSQR